MMIIILFTAFRIAHNLCVSGTNLCRSVSSAGEHQSETFVLPLLPKRAETFGGFDHPGKDQSIASNNLKKKLPQIKDTITTLIVSNKAASNDLGHIESDSSSEIVNSSTINVNNRLTSHDALLSINVSSNNTNNPSNNIGKDEDTKRRSSGPLFSKCSSGSSSPEKVQRRSLVCTPAASTLSLTTLSATSPTSAPTSPQKTINANVSNTSNVIMPLYDANDIYRLTTTPLLMTQGKDQLLQIAELQHQVNVLMVKNYEYFNSLLFCPFLNYQIPFHCIFASIKIISIFNSFSTLICSFIYLQI